MSEAPTHARDERIRELRAKGMRRTEIARAIGYSVATVDKVLYAKSTKRTRHSVRKPSDKPEAFVEKECRQCFVKFKSPLQNGRQLYWLCNAHRVAV